MCVAISVEYKDAGEAACVSCGRQSRQRRRLPALQTDRKRERDLERHRQMKREKERESKLSRDTDRLGEKESVL